MGIEVAAVVTFVEALTVVETVAAVGATMAVVGAVTGNKELTQLGATMAIGAGIAGAVGGLMEGGALMEGAASGSEVAGSMGSWDVPGYMGEAATGAAEGATGLVSSAGTSGSAAMDVQLGVDGMGGVGAAPPAAPAAMSSGSAGVDAALGADGMGGQAASAVAQTPINVAEQSTGLADAAASTNVANTTAATVDPSSMGSWDVPGNVAKIGNEAYFAGMGKWVKDNQNLVGMMGMGAMQGAGKAYEADRNYGINKDLLTMKQQQQSWGNTAARYDYGLVNRARSV